MELRSQENLPEVRFTAGSCAMRSKVLDKWSFKIFDKMAEKRPQFNLWLGDHVYMLLPSHWENKQSIIDHYQWQRSQPKLKKFLDSFPQYAIWDDHDYGPNNSGASFSGKDESRKAFMEMWQLPQYGQNNRGIYYDFQKEDAHFFMLDCRYFMNKDSGVLLGSEQLNWLKVGLKNSSTTFKFLVFSVQALCDGGYENLRKFPNEYAEIIDFIEKEQIEGVLFLSGDVHYAEITLEDRPHAYPLFDFTFSALTSMPHYFGPKNLKSLEGFRKSSNNFGLLSITGPKGNRTLRVSLNSRSGKEFWEMNIPERLLKYQK